jgi:hypothetical protein
MNRTQLTVAALLLAAIVTTPGCARMDPEAVTVLYADHVVVVEDTLADPSDLWVTPEDLTRINGFELKPEGACLDTLCIPVNQTEDSDIVVNRAGQSWFSLTAFARKLNQAYGVDRTHRIWSFSEVPILRSAFLDNAVAPDFELPDRQGNSVRLSDFRGKKVLLLTWASW